MKGLLILLFILTGLFGIFMVRKGMIQVDRQESKTVIEVDTQRMRQVTQETVNEVVEDSKRILTDSARSVERAISNDAPDKPGATIAP
jgi:hypothetical protein